MSEIDRLLAGNDAYAPAHVSIADARPRQKVAILTCMDARIDVLAAFGLDLGDAHILRNVGGRVTDDVLRSLALSSHVLGVDTVIVMEHTKCGLLGVTADELRDATGAGIDFLPIADNEAALRADVGILTSTPYLAPITSIAGCVYDIEHGKVTEIVRWDRPA